jgi:hypothetical protein
MGEINNFILIRQQNNDNKWINFFFILKKYDHENLRKNIFLKGGKWYNMRLWQLIQHVFFMANIKKKKKKVDG